MMTSERRAQILARLREMQCRRQSDPLLRSLYSGWTENADGTKTFWHFGDGVELVEGVTVSADADPADFEQLQLFLDA